MNQMGKMILIRSSWKAYVDLRHIELEFVRNEKIDPEIHFPVFSEEELKIL